MPATESAGHSPVEPGTTDGSAAGGVRALPGGVAAVAVGVLLWVVGGRLGLVGGGALLVAWAVLPATYAFAVGQVVLVAATRPRAFSRSVSCRWHSSNSDWQACWWGRLSGRPAADARRRGPCSVGVSSPESHW